MTDGKCRAHQGTRSEETDLRAAPNGVVVLKTIDPATPFLFEVADRVCAIGGGAFIDPDDPAIEYGGTWFDWTLVRDSKDPQTKFGRNTLLSCAPMANDAPSTASGSTSTSCGAPSTRSRGGRRPAVRIAAVPVRIRTGPIVRYTDRERACIWVEPSTPSLVKVVAKRAGGKPRRSGRCLDGARGRPTLRGRRDRRACSRHLLQIHARARSAAGNGSDSRRVGRSLESVPQDHQRRGQR